MAEQSSAVVEKIMVGNRLKSAKHIKKIQRQVNKKFCELNRRNIGIAEKAKETRFGMLYMHRRYDKGKVYLINHGLCLM